eukprot:2759990-Heterocapsa_arctica.AAC.1
MFADVSSAVNTGCFFIPAHPEAQPRSNSTGNMQPGMDSSAHGCSSGRPYKHTTRAATGHGSSSHGTQHSWIEERHLTDEQIDVGMSVAFDRLLHSNDNIDPSRHAPMQNIDFKWALEMRGIWKGTQLRDAWITDRGSLQCAWGLAIALTQPFFTQNPDRPADARARLDHIPSDAGVCRGVA